MRMNSLACILFALTLVRPVMAQEIFDGVAAYRSGDYATALQVFEDLADAGNPAAQSFLGTIYDNGHGVPQNSNVAAAWYRRAAEQGHEGAQHNLGLKYFKGEGVPKNYSEAARLFRLASKRGLSSAQGNLGFMYASGHGVPQSFVLAHMWFNIASGNGNKLATRNRSGIENTMTSEQISDAQDRAVRCISSNYQNCD